jgi:nitroreductase
MSKKSIDLNKPHSQYQGIRCIVITGKDKIRELQNTALPILGKLMQRLGFMASLPIGKSIMGKKLADLITGIYAVNWDLFRERIQKGDDLLFYNAHALMIMYGEKVDEASAFSCAAALYNASLMAHTMGIGSCFNGFLQGVINSNKKIKEQLGIPKYCNCRGAMTLGYPGVKYNRLTMRKPLEVRWM